MSNGAPPGTWNNLLYPPECNFPGATPDPNKYTYFRQNPTPANLKGWIADAAIMAYGRSQETRMSAGQFSSILTAGGFIDFHLIGRWDGAKGTQGFFASRPDLAVLSFRGTEPDDWTKLLADVAAVPDPVNLNGSIVDAGFWLALDTVWSETARILTGYRASQPDTPIYFTGHSLGGALATIALWRFRKDTTDQNLSLYTIGSPRVGNQTFCAQVRDRAMQRVFRYVDGNDMVTHVPTESAVYTHVSAALPIGAPATPGSSEVLTVLSDARQAIVDLALHRDPPADLADHSPIRYLYYLWQ